MNYSYLNDFSDAAYLTCSHFLRRTPNVGGYDLKYTHYEPTQNRFKTALKPLLGAFSTSLL